MAAYTIAPPFASVLQITSLATFPTRLSTQSRFPNTNPNSKTIYRPHSRLFLQRCASMISITKEVDLRTKKELGVTIHRSSIVTPMEESQRKSMFLSNIDHFLNFKTSSVFFFSKNTSFPLETVVETLETAYRKLLVSYDFMAGRLGLDQQGRLEIDCNSTGAGFVVASSELLLEDLGDLVSPDPYYQKLAVRKLPGFHARDQPLNILQITSFKCGGFSMGVTSNHMLLDGIGYKFFFENLASLSRNEPLVLGPQNDRRFLSSRSPPHVRFPHPELIDLDNPQGNKSSLAPLSSSFRKIQSKAFYLSAYDIAVLKEKAKMGKEENKNRLRATDFNVVLAHIWRCLSLAKYSRNDQVKMCSLLYAVNIRPRLRPRLPSSYSGNALYNAYCTATYNELERGPFSRLVHLIAQAERQITDEYIRSSLDWKDLHNGFMYGDTLVSSWWKLGYNDTIYPWGKPKWNSPVLQNYGNNAVVILPEIEGTSGKGVNIIVSLEPKDMEKLQSLFYALLK